VGTSGVRARSTVLMQCHTIVEHYIQMIHMILMCALRMQVWVLGDLHGRGPGVHGVGASPDGTRPTVLMQYVQN
jgi:hypothetical protein